MKFCHECKYNKLENCFLTLKDKRAYSKCVNKKVENNENQIFKGLDLNILKSEIFADLARKNNKICGKEGKYWEPNIKLIKNSLFNNEPLYKKLFYKNKFKKFKINLKDFNSIRTWCEENILGKWTIIGDLVCLCDKEDQTKFIMRWV